MRYLIGLILLLLIALGAAYVAAGRGGPPSITIAKPEKWVGVEHAPRSRCWRTRRAVQEPYRRVRSERQADDAVFDGERAAVGRGDQDGWSRQARDQPHDRKRDGSRPADRAGPHHGQRVPDGTARPSHAAVDGKPRRAGPSRAAPGFDRLVEALHQSRRLGDGRLSCDAL